MAMIFILYSLNSAQSASICSGKKACSAYFGSNRPVCGAKADSCKTISDSAIVMTACSAAP